MEINHNSTKESGKKKLTIFIVDANNLKRHEYVGVKCDKNDRRNTKERKCLFRK